MVRLQKSDHYEKKNQSLLYVYIPEPFTLAGDGHPVSCKCAGWTFFGGAVSHHSGGYACDHLQSFIAKDNPDMVCILRLAF